MPVLALDAVHSLSKCPDGQTYSVCVVFMNDFMWVCHWRPQDSEMPPDWQKETVTVTVSETSASI